MKFITKIITFALFFGLFPWNLELGTCSAQPCWVASGAAIGDTSAWQDPPVSLTLAHPVSGESLTANTFTGSPAVVYVYLVDTTPAILSGPNCPPSATNSMVCTPGPGTGCTQIGCSATNDRYFGVFIADTSVATPVTYTAIYDYAGNPYITPAIVPGLILGGRNNNSVIPWVDLGAALVPTTLVKTLETAGRGEYILSTMMKASVTSTNINCNAQCNGTASVTAGGGCAPYTYSWNNGQTTSTATGLCAGDYTVTVTDSIFTLATATITITQPDSITVSASSTDTDCNANTGTATVISPSGGTPGYSYSWTTTPVQIAATATGLPAGNYIATITDANGCTATQTVAVAAPVGPTAALSTQTNVSCNGGTNGSAAVSASGGTPAYTYSWNTIPVQTNDTATGLPAGNYTVTVTDDNGCTAQQTVTITQPTPITANTSSTNTDCNASTGTAAIISPSGGTPGYSYSWTTTPVQIAATATGLPAGNYIATITDANGCTATKTVTVAANPGPQVTLSPGVTINPGDNTLLTATITGSGSFLWNTGATTSAITVSPTQTTNYCVTVADVNGCADSSCVTVTIEMPCGQLYLPTAFSPNNDGENELEPKSRKRNC